MSSELNNITNILVSANTSCLFVDDTLYSEDISNAYHLPLPKRSHPSNQLPPFLFGCPTSGAPLFSSNLFTSDAEIAD